jgi:hypothetical protein
MAKGYRQWICVGKIVLGTFQQWVHQTYQCVEEGGKLHALATLKICIIQNFVEI